MKSDGLYPRRLIIVSDGVPKATAMKCIICGKPAVAGYSGKSYCKEHYEKYLREVHDWRRK